MKKLMYIFILLISPLFTFSQVTADFSASQSYCYVGDSICFVSLCTGENTSCFWQFGDGQTSELENPIMHFYTPGCYSVVIFVTNDFQSDSLRVDSCFTVLEALGVNELPNGNTGSVVVYSLSGSIVASKHNCDTDMFIEGLCAGSRIVRGIYICNISVGNKMRSGKIYID